MHFYENEGSGYSLNILPFQVIYDLPLSEALNKGPESKSGRNKRVAKRR